MTTLRFAIMGTGFWSTYQLAGWYETGGVECVALYNRTRAKAEMLAQKFGISAVYDEAEALVHHEELDFIDIITDVDTHSQFVHLAAKHKIPVICQKPMAPNFETAQKMVEVCQEAGVPFMVHENWRWQVPIRQVKQMLTESKVGPPFRAHILYANSFPIFDNQPFLKELEQFILTDMGSHILDVARFLFGDAHSLYCQTQQIMPGIKGEDVATVMMKMGDNVIVTCSMSYASRLEHDRFPETYIFIECENGSVELGPDFWIKTTTPDGTLAQRHVPPRYQWANPTHDVVHASIVTCNANLLHALQTGETAETNAADNLKTMQLVFDAYESAQTGQVITP